MSIMLKNILNIENLAQYLILSNTPFYLYRKFSRDDSIQKLSDQLTSKQLIKKFNEFSKKDKKSFENLVIIYSLIVALSLKPYNEVIDFFKGLTSFKIKWVDYLKDIYFSRISSENLISLSINYQTTKKVLVKNLTTTDNYHKSNIVLR